MDTKGNLIEVPQWKSIVVNGSVPIPKHENEGKNPAYKSIHSTSIILPLK